LRQLGVWAVLLGLADLSETAWRKRLAKCGDWLNWLVQEALVGTREHGGRQKGVGRVDGTRLRPPGGAGKEGWLVQMIYDIGAGALVDIRVGDAHLAETVQGLPLEKGECCSMIAALRAVLALRQSRVCRLTNWGMPHK